MRDYPRLVRASIVAVLVGRLLSFAKKSTDDGGGGGGGEEAASKKRESFVLSLFFPNARQLLKNFCPGLPFSFPEKGSCFFLPFFLAQKQHRLKRY
jgi:hypothetical protein